TRPSGGPGDNRGDRVDNRGDRVDNRGDVRSDRVENRGDRRTDRREHRQEIGQDVRGKYADRRHGVFPPGHWTNHPHARWHYHHGNRPPGYWWRPATWAALTGWMIGAASNPVYYDYGSGGNVYYDDGSVYVGEEAYPAEQYTESVAAVATNVPEVDPNAVEWMPLGVFALTNESGADPTMFFQLTVSKEGIIAGTYQNTSTGANESLEGMVDKSSQRAVWRVVDKERPVMETGVYNLTEDQTSALVHFPDGQIQEWLMVRLEEPQQEGQSAPAPPTGS
ncbi:MAG: mu-protocadherin- cell-suface protein, partial [Planctomycetota bacterium]